MKRLSDAVIDKIIECTPNSELGLACLELKERRAYYQAADEYIDFLEKYWGIPERLTNDSPTKPARDKYISSKNSLPPPPQEKEQLNLLPWNERVVMLLINPHAATIEDIARMATELMEKT